MGNQPRELLQLNENDISECPRFASNVTNVSSSLTVSDEQT
jgi:hypothetical protein